MRRKHDESYKLLFSLPVAVEDLVHRCLPRWARQLDFTTIEKLSTEQVGPALARRHVDLLWKVRFRESLQRAAALDGPGELFRPDRSGS